MTDNKFAEKMISQYSPKTLTKVDELKIIDKKVKTPVRVFAYIFGILGSLILGTGMCLTMKVIGGTTPLMIVGVIIGVIGIIIVSVNYSIYSKILKNRKEKFAKQIINKSNEILEQN